MGFLKGKNEGGTEGETLDLGHGKWGEIASNVRGDA